MDYYTDLIGTTLDNRYELIDELGRGGMGLVFKGHHSSLGRDVAIKVMHPQYTRQLSFQERFLQEAQVLARLDHPSIVKVFDSGRDKGALLYLVMEFIPGDNLHELLQKLWRNSQWILLPEAIGLVKQLCFAVDYVHRQGVLHRDIKPANIMLKLTDQGAPYQPILMDLGLAKLIDGGLVTGEDKTMGTPAYMSPEQALRRPTDARSDVYSLGVLLYELTVGRLPFPIKDFQDAVRYHTQDKQPLPPQQLNPNLPDLVGKAILKALKRNPDKRFADATAFAEALTYIESRVPSDSAPPTAMEGAVSLMTEFQESLVNVRGSSIKAEFPDSINTSGQARIRILTPDNLTRSVLIEGRRLEIGRSPHNDIVLDDGKVSGRHARIEYDGLNYKVVDLDSTNGTFLANVALTPGVPKVWTPDQVLRIGQNYLRLEVGRPATKGTLTRTDGTMVNPDFVHTSAGEARVAVFMEPGPVTVEPGQSISLTLTALNQGSIVDHFKVSVSGVPDAWLTISSQAIKLLPATQGEFTLIVQPPRTSESVSGDYLLTIQVASQDALTERVVLTKSLTVEPFHQLSSELRPQRISAGRAAQLTLHNQGNGTEIFTIKWQDRADEVSFDPMHTSVEVPAGTEEVVTFRANPRHRPWLGGRQNHPFTAQVITPWGDKQPIAGEVVSASRLPVWLLTLFLFGCAALLGVGSFLFYTEQQNIAQATQTAEAVQATGTHIAQLADSDGDGLPDIDEEQKWKTNPDLADTDRDGLSDKEEVDGGQTDPKDNDTDNDGLADGEERRFGADPVNGDSDGDGLKDGDEVAQGTLPNNPDTDGDGVRDNVDPDPGRLPTPTPTTTATTTPTLTPTPTVTPNSGATATTEAAIAATLTAEAEIAQINNQLGLAISYFNQGQYEQAISIYTALLQERPNDPDIKNRLAQAYFQQGVSNHSNGMSYMNQSSYELASNYFEQAITQFQQALQYSSDSRNVSGWIAIASGDTFFNQGKMANEQNDVDRAITLFGQAIGEFEKFLGLAANQSNIDTANNRLSNAHYLRGLAYTTRFEISNDEQDLDRALADLDWLETSGANPTLILNLFERMKQALDNANK